jgi:hypothetical protein
VRTVPKFKATDQFPLSKIRLDGGTQMRVDLVQETIDEYATAMKDGEKFDPIDVFADDEAKTYWLVDGFHRVEAARKAGLTSIRARVYRGSLRDAILRAAGANARHGLRRTNADKRKAVEALLRDTEWSAWSDREIAARCSVSDRFVNKLRAELSANGSQMPATRKAIRGGREYTVNTAPIADAARGRADKGEQRVVREPVEKYDERTPDLDTTASAEYLPAADAPATAETEPFTCPMCKGTGKLNRPREQISASGMAEGRQIES